MRLDYYQYELALFFHLRSSRRKLAQDLEKTALSSFSLSSLAWLYVDKAAVLEEGARKLYLVQPAKKLDPVKPYKAKAWQAGSQLYGSRHRNDVP